MILFLTLVEVIKPNRDWIDITGAIGAIATTCAFLYLFYQQYLNKSLRFKTDEENEKQQVRNNIQQFENSLFNLLSLHNQIIDHVSYFQSGFANLTADKYSQGRDTFNDAYYKLNSICSRKIIFDYTMPEQIQYKKTHGERDIANSSEARDRLVNEYYIYYYYAFEPILNHYFRNLYHIFKYIDNSDLISESLRHDYASIVRAQLSPNELYAIMFNMLMQDYGYPKFLLLDKKYNILKNFRASETQLRYFYELYSQMRKDVMTTKDANGINFKRER